MTLPASMTIPLPDSVFEDSMAREAARDSFHSAGPLANALALHPSIAIAVFVLALALVTVALWRAWGDREP